MIIQEFFDKYDLDSQDLDLIVNDMLDGKSLKYISDKFEECDEKSIYAICTTYCKEELLLPISEVSPIIFEERKKMLDEKKDEFAIIKLRKRIYNQILDVKTDLEDYIKEKSQ